MPALSQASFTISELKRLIAELESGDSAGMEANLEHLRGQGYHDKVRAYEEKMAAARKSLPELRRALKRLLQQVDEAEQHYAQIP